ncbi:MAG: hypothetical protein AB7K63_18400, partial [Vicinamibacterales bacterium]
MRTKIQALDERLTRLRVEKNRLIARATQTERKRDTRRKILVGGAVLAGLDPVLWTSSERWIRCPDRWQTPRSAGRAGSLTTSSKPRLSA